MKKFILLFYRLFLPLINLKKLLTSIKNFLRYFKFFLEFFLYKKKTEEKVNLINLYPCLSDKTSSTQTGKGHYFFQDVWALKKISDSEVNKHVDIGSRIDGFVGQCSALCDVEFVDYRSVDINISGFRSIKGSILDLPYDSNSLNSVTCLHVIEHIGLGRYGDSIDIKGSIKAAKELIRVLMPGGNLYLGTPVGVERVEFNAHRIFDPKTILLYFKELELVSFSAVNDSGDFEENTELEKYSLSHYSCGLFHFIKKI